MSIFKKDLTLDVIKTAQHIEMIIDKGCHGVAIF
jgi:4-hydroxy-tetrahydrodipicolinate synthase